MYDRRAWRSVEDEERGRHRQKQGYPVSPFGTKTKPLDKVKQIFLGNTIEGASYIKFKHKRQSLLPIQ